eukprot:4219577-Prymnesium_polylepis.2
MVPHTGVSNLLRGARGRPYPVRLVSYALSFNYAFDPFSFGLLLSLCCLDGHCHLLQDSLALLSLQEEVGVTCLNDVPSVISAAQLPSTVRWVEVGGEPLTLSTTDNVSSAAKLFNAYGPTEASVACT